MTTAFDIDAEFEQNGAEDAITTQPDAFGDASEQPNAHFELNDLDHDGRSDFAGMDTDGEDALETTLSAPTESEQMPIEGSEHSPMVEYDGVSDVSFCGKRDDILRDIQQARSDIEYYAKQVARLTSEKAEGWIVDSTLSYNKGCLDSAKTRLHDLERDLSYAKD